MNSRTRKKLYEMLAARDGEYCRMCGKVGSRETLCIDHIDNNNSNNEHDNFQLLCKSCNTKKNPRGKSKPKNDSVEIHEPPTSRQIVLNERYEPTFRDYAERQLTRWNRIPLKDLINSGAEVTGASPQTIERYLDKMCSTAGKLTVVLVDGVKHVEFKSWLSPK